MRDDGNVRREGTGAFGRLKDPRAIFPSVGPTVPTSRLGDVEPGRLEMRESFARRATKVLAIVLAVAAGLGMAWFVHEREADPWLTVFAFTITGIAVAGIRDVALVRPHAVKAFQVALLPLFSTWFLFGSYRAFERWWAAVLAGYVLGFLATLWVSKRVFGDVLETAAHGRTAVRVSLRSEGDLRMPRRCVRCGEADPSATVALPVEGKVREQERKVVLRFPVDLPSCPSCAQVDDEVARWTRSRNVALVVILVLFAMGVAVYLRRWNDSSPFDILAMAGIFMLVAPLLVPKIEPKAWTLLGAVAFLGMEATPGGQLSLDVSFADRTFATAFASLNDGRATPAG
jgi:hypothetical protein